MARVEKEFAAIQLKYEAARQLLPEEKEVANLLRMVSLVGQQAGVEFELFRPLPPLDRGYYVENPVDVKVTGDYHEVGSFLADVANLSRIVKVSNLNLAGRDANEETSTVTASFTAAAFTLNPNPAPAETPAAGQADPKADARAGKAGKAKESPAGKAGEADHES
jgi:type IV pilus assembly protein PilO